MLLVRMISFILAVNMTEHLLAPSADAVSHLQDGISRSQYNPGGSRVEVGRAHKYVHVCRERAARGLRQQMKSPFKRKFMAFISHHLNPFFFLCHPED